MKSKTLNIIEIFAHIVSIGLLFKSEMFYCYLGETTVNNRFTDLPSGSVLPIIFVVLIIISLFLCIKWALSKNKMKFNFIHIFSQIGAIIIYCLIGMLYSNGEYYTLVEMLSSELNETSRAYTVGPFFFVEIALLILIFIISTIKTKQYRENDIVVAEKKETVENVDLLIKYNELLRTGAITQEEFEAKKKQLLDL